jgi:protein phosphatase
MRVLGDVDAAPEIDTKILDTRPGDRWLLCSDGLSSYVSEEKIATILQTAVGAQAAADRLVKESLDHGAPDNVTVIIEDIGDVEDTSAVPRFVGSAASPLSFEGESTRRPIRLPTLLLHPLKATQPEDAHFEPEREGYLEELLEEDRRRAFRRRITWIVVVLVAVAAIVTAVLVGYQWTQSRYYVGVDQGRVAVYRGVQQNVGPIKLSSVYQATSIDVSDLSAFERQNVQRTIPADDLRDALAIVDRLQTAAGDRQ